MAGYVPNEFDVCLAKASLVTLENVDFLYLCVLDMVALPNLLGSGAWRHKQRWEQRLTRWEIVV